MARTISAELLAAQQSLSFQPYVRVSIGGHNYSGKLLYLEHHEEAYRDRAVLIFQNSDRSMYDVDLTGKMFRIGYGHITGNAVAEPDGNNSTAEYSYSAPLWVKNQWFTSSEGTLLCQLYCEGAWMYMREQLVIAYGTSPYFDIVFDKLYTIYELMEALIESAMGWSLAATPSPDDTILNTFKPVFDINSLPYENFASVLYRLIGMTMCYIRIKSNVGFDYPELEIVYPMEGDSADEKFYSYKAPYFIEYNEKVNLLIPNTINVLCNQNEDGSWSPETIIIGYASEPAEAAKYTEVSDLFIDGTIDNASDANLRASAILTRVQAEQLAGRLVIPHDARIELYDKVRILDRRGT